MPDWLGRTAPGDLIRGGDEAADVQADKGSKGASGHNGHSGPCGRLQARRGVLRNTSQNLGGGQYRDYTECWVFAKCSS